MSNDADGDGISDGAELSYGTDPNNWDTDNDGLDDLWDRNQACLNGATTPDNVDEDPDGDGASTIEEYLYSRDLDPCDPDTDNDGILDGIELGHAICMDPIGDDADDDPDGDGVTNADEIAAGTDPCVDEDAMPDADGDGLPDQWEDDHACTDPIVPDAGEDPDGDGLVNADEFAYHTDPCNPDTDGDGADDGDEVACQTSPIFPEIPDQDRDGLSNADECVIGTSPYEPDSDHDFIGDLDEYNAGTTSPIDFDSDGDGLGDGAEVMVFMTDPAEADQDGDLMPDGWEVEWGLDPWTVDGTGNADGDSLINAAEYEAGANPRSKDSDMDGFDDWWEWNHAVLGFDPVAADCHDPEADADGDHLPDYVEYVTGTGPTSVDSDGDGMDDWWEFVAGLDPLADDAGGDPDGDGRDNLAEYTNEGYYYTNPMKVDTDGDRLCDGYAAVGACDGWEGPDRSEAERARLRLNPWRPIGSVAAGGVAEVLPDGGIEIGGEFEPGEYEVLLVDEDGRGYWIDATLAGATLHVDLSGGIDVDGNIIPAGAYDLYVYYDGAPLPELLRSEPVYINIHRLLFIHHGLHGPVAATDHLGTVVWRRNYLPFGGELTECVDAPPAAAAAAVSPTSATAPSPDPAVSVTTSATAPVTFSLPQCDPHLRQGGNLVNLGFVSRYFDDDVGLYNLGHRWYDPAIGRFLSTDPIQSSLNQYAYAGNNPFVYRDSDGLAKFRSGSLYFTPEELNALEYSAEQPPIYIDPEGAKEAGIFLGDVGSGFIPFVNDARDWCELVGGIDCVTGEPLAWYWRGLSGVGLVVGSGSGIRKGARFFTGIGTIDDVSTFSRRTGRGVGAIGTARRGVRYVGHHTVPKEVLKNLPPDVASHPLVRGSKGAPNVWQVPEDVHDLLHRAGPGGGPWNIEWKKELDLLRESKKPINVENVLMIRNKLIYNFGLMKYAPR